MDFALEKIWFILINGERKGPFSVSELKQIPELTPDTLAWREGFVNWVPIRNIPELRELFEEKDETQEDEEQAARRTPLRDDTISLEFSEPPLFLWLLFVVLVLLYVIFQLYYKH